MNTGETFDLVFQWKDHAGVLTNFTGYTIKAQIRTAELPDGVLILDLTPFFTIATTSLNLVVDATTTAALPPGGYYWDLFVTIGGVTKRLLSGVATVLGRETT
jgi:hypothetical protein